MMTDQATGKPGTLAPATGREQADAEFERLFLAHFQEIYRHLYRMVSDAQHAEDLAQETFLRLHRQGFSPDGAHHVRAWLYRVATNLAYNALRGHTRRQRREAALGAEGVAADPAEMVERRVQQQAVREVLADLPERQAQLLLLRHAGLSYKELAAILDVAPNSVGTLLARAHKAFEAAYYRSLEASQGGEHHGV